jgi:bifunctional enzyme CysN/CysC
MEACAEPRSPILRFLVAGNVDDGKSTLVGRLLHDSNAVYQDQLASVRALSGSAGLHALDFALITDGLKAEREQGITIDVAYRYFSTQRRKFILADVPGHEQYTRNMATGASTAELALLLIDVSRGAKVQTHRHALIAWLFGIRNFVVVVNKMDLVGFSEGAFREVEGGFSQFAAKLGEINIQFVPTSSLQGDNVVLRSHRMPWFTGGSLLEVLETTSLTAGNSHCALRLPVQWVIRSTSEPRRYAGQLSSGVIRREREVLAMSSGCISRVQSVRIGDHDLDLAVPSMSITVALQDDLDTGRGDMLVDPSRPPQALERMRATLLWMGSEPLKVGEPYLVKHTTRTVCASISQIRFRIDPSSLDQQSTDTLSTNEFGDVDLELQRPLYADLYCENRLTGAFIVMDPITNATLGAGMVADCEARSTDAASRFSANTGLVVWFTGLSSAGKSTISQMVYEKLWARGFRVEWLDGDLVRQNLSRGLGYTRQDRDENIRRIGFVAELLVRHGVIVLVSAISPHMNVREEIRMRIGRFIEVYVNAPLETCEQRDTKGIYRRCCTGEIHNVTGLDDPYEAPLNPQVECQTHVETCAESAGKVLQAVDKWLEQAQQPYLRSHV